MKVTVMKNYLKFMVVGALCCFIALFVGCTSSRLVNIWSDSEYKAPVMNKMLVISLSKNPSIRRIWEDSFVVELAKHNVDGNPSYRMFPDDVPDTNQVNEIIKSNGYDGFLVIRRLPPETNAQYQPGYMTREQNMRYDRRRDRFITYYRNVQYGGYIDSQKVDIRAIDVWTAKDEGQMIWSATSKTPEPNTVQEIRPEIITLVLTELTQQGIIGKLR